MKNDNNGCSTTKTGIENYEILVTRNRTYYQYDYRHTNGELFSTVKPSLELCRAARDKWLEQE